MPKRTKVPKYCSHVSGSAFSKYRGKFFWFGKFGTDESRAKYRRFLESIETAESVESIDTSTFATRSVARVAVLYLEYCDGYYVDAAGKKNAEHKAMEAMTAAVCAVMGEEIAAGIGPAQFSKLQKYLIAKDHARTYVNKTVSRAKRMFRWACNNALCPPAVYHGLACVEPLRKGRTKARESEDVVPVPRAVVDATLPFLTPVVADMVEVQYRCGMRPSELCRMRPCDIDRSKDIWLYRPITHKGAWRGHHRVIAIPPIAQRILELYLEREPTAWLFSPRDAEKIRNDRRKATLKADRKTPRYPSEDRRLAKQKLARRATAFTRLRHAYDPNSYRRAIDYAIKKAERRGTTIYAWFPYQLRHAAATDVAQALGQVAAQRWLGHESLDTTQIYIEKDIGDLIETARQLDRIWAVP